MKRDASCVDAEGMTRITIWASVFLIVTAGASADTLEKKDGSVFTYTFAGTRAPQQKAKKQK